MFWVELAPLGAWVWFFEDSFFSVTLHPSTGWVGWGQAGK